MSKVNRYKATGFVPLTEINSGDLITGLAAVVSIKKGDVLHNVSGYASNADTAFTHELLGVATEDVDNSGGSVGDLDVQYIDYKSNVQFIAPVLSDALVTQADVGVLCDLEAVNTVDINDAVTDAPGFRIEEIDVCAEAIAANTYGYVIGRFKTDS